MKRLEIIGDSILKGVIYIGDTGRYHLYGSTLEQRLAEHGIVAHRNCRMGATIETGRSRLQALLDSREDLSDTQILLEFGGNDSSYDWALVSSAPELPHTPHTPPEVFSEVYASMIGAAQARGATVAAATLLPIDADKYMNFISRGLSYSNILSWLGDVSMLYRWHEGYDHAVRRIAGRCGCPLLDLREAFLCSHRFSGLLCDDGIHPTTEGHRLIEDTIVAAL